MIFQYLDKCFSIFTLSSFLHPAYPFERPVYTCEIWRSMVSAHLGAPVFRRSQPWPICLSDRSDVPPILDDLRHHAAICMAGTGAVRRLRRLCDLIYHEMSHPAISFSVKRERVLRADLHTVPLLFTLQFYVCLFRLIVATASKIINLLSS